MASLFSKTLNSDEFKTLLQETSAKKDASIDDVNIQGFEIPNKTIRNMTFSNSEWNNVTMTDQHHLEDVTFENCVINNSDFTGVNLKNVRFKKCKIHNVIFNKARFDKVIFEKCDIDSTDTNIDHSYREMLGGELEFIESKITSINFFHSRMKVYFNHSEMNDIKALGLKEGSLLSIIDSKAFLIDFSRSIFDTLTVKNSTIKESKANNCRIGTVLLEDSDLGFPIGDGKGYDKVIAKNTKNVVIGGTPVKDITITDCRRSYNIFLADMKFENIYVNNCDTSNFVFFESTGGTMTVSNINTSRFDFRYTDIKHLILENIHIRGDLQYDKAKIKQLETKNITFDSDIKIKSEGANIELKPDVIKPAEY